MLHNLSAFHACFCIYSFQLDVEQPVVIVTKSKCHRLPNGQAETTNLNLVRRKSIYAE